ncbi:hypothetical protein J1N35_038880 [Gossypium stocksii]|uniref:Transmembrane protein n=1 Tax=Gossypium stocksii TaxID=47602 RepID=A0A9D3UMX6_9ROSI|nr:hypothetical protein J1N35_038880 [Gossypium stocksii]
MWERGFKPPWALPFPLSSFCSCLPLFFAFYFVLGMNFGCILAFPWVDLMGSSGGRYLASVPSNLRHPLVIRVHGTVPGCMFPPKGFRGWSILGLLHRQVVSYGCNVYPDRTLEVKMKTKRLGLVLYFGVWNKVEALSVLVYFVSCWPLVAFCVRQVVLIFSSSDVAVLYSSTCSHVWFDHVMVLFTVLMEFP